MASTSPRAEQQTLLPSGSPATLSPAAPATPAVPTTDHGGEATHQWIPAGSGTPMDPSDTNGWMSAPWSATATPWQQQEMLAK
eukprot:3327242-Amphidinium_carterae.1